MSHSKFVNMNMLNQLLLSLVPRPLPLREEPGAGLIVAMMSDLMLKPACLNGWWEGVCIHYYTMVQFPMLPAEFSIEMGHLEQIC